jgi:hypothetical protein
MSEFPALRDALVGAATRRRRRRRVASAALPLIAACVVAATLVSLPMGQAPEREDVAPKPPTELEQLYGVFRRPQRPEDVMPAGPRDRNAMAAEQTRLVASNGSSRFFAGPTRDGGSLCTITVSGGGYSGGCGPISALREDVAQGGWMGTIYALLFQDGARDVRLLLQNGGREAPRLREGGLLASSPVGYTGVSWTTPSGIRIVNRIKPPQPPLLPPCMGPMDPLPDDAVAQAKRAALLEVDQVFPTVQRARVVNAAQYFGKACGKTNGPRAIVVTLDLATVPGARHTQGRLVVGKVEGAMRVVHQLR